MMASEQSPDPSPVPKAGTGAPPPQDGPREDTVAASEAATQDQRPALAETAPEDEPAVAPGAEPVAKPGSGLDARSVAAVANPAPEAETAALDPAPEPEPSPPDHPNPALANAAVLAQSRARTRRSFLGAAAAAAAGFGFYEYLQRGPQLETQPAPLRHAFGFNAALARNLFESHILAPTYPLSRAETLRLNGFYGLKRALVPASWRLQLVGMANAANHPRYTADVTAWEYEYTNEPGNEPRDQPQDQAQLAQVNPDVLPSLPPPNLPGDDQTEDDNDTGRRPRGFEEAGESNSTLPPRTPGLLLSMADILKLPRHELVTQFKCIEGWSQIVHWGGVRVADFLEAYPPAPIDGREPKYVYMETPDGDYYTGYDLSALRHPQTLLVTEMMGAPLTRYHGAPLRLHMPTKYGYKQIKRIGLIAYTNDKPDDYWTKLGYDWFAGL